MLLLIQIATVIAILLFVALYVVIVVAPLLFLMKSLGAVRVRRWRRAAGYSALAILSVSVPMIGWQAFNWWSDERAKQVRVPNLLDVAATEYSIEKTTGLGPGDESAAFAVYRLTSASRAWLQEIGADLPLISPGGVGGGEWKATPIARLPEQEAEVFAHRMSPSFDVSGKIHEFGSLIDIDGVWLNRANDLMSSPGAFFRFDTRNSSLSIIDPARGRVYFVYPAFTRTTRPRSPPAGSTPDASSRPR